MKCLVVDYSRTGVTRSLGQVLAGTPIRDGGATPWVPTCLENNRDSLPAVAFFGTMAGDNCGRAETRMRDVPGREPEGTFWVRSDAVKTGHHFAAVKEFVQQLAVADTE